jgi:hypothetical protein
MVECLADRWPVREGPVAMALAPVSTLLNLVFWLDKNPNAGFVRSGATTTPELAIAARSLVASGSVGILKRQPAGQAFVSLSERLSS